MTRLALTIGCWNYDRVQAIADGRVRPDGIDVNFLAMPVEETFFRMLRHREFDVAEMSLSSYCVTCQRDPRPFVAIPVFPSRCFRHRSIFVNTQAGIRSPADLVGRRVGCPEYQMTAPVWIRGILADGHGVPVESVRYVTGGEESPGRDEKVALDLPPAIRVDRIGPERTLAAMLADGEIDALYTARTPSTFRSRPDRVARLFPDFERVERDDFRRTGVFPIMHTIVIRREVYEAHRWIAQSLVKAFVEAQRITYDDLAQSAALKTMLPWLTAHVERTIGDMGADWWPYGFGRNRATLDVFLRYHHEQGLSRRRLVPEELFAPETLESYVI